MRFCQHLFSLEKKGVKENRRSSSVHPAFWILPLSLLLLQSCNREEPVVEAPAVTVEVTTLPPTEPQVIAKTAEETVATELVPFPVVPEPTPLPTATPTDLLKSGGDLIVAGDLLQIDVEGQPKYSGPVRVSAQGTPFYNLGTLPGVSGSDTRQLAADLERRYRERDLRNPRITVSVREFAPRRVYLSGSLQRPGAVLLAPGGSLTLLRAIAEAGGFTEGANRQLIRLLRTNQPAQTLDAAVLEFNPASDPRLQPDDQILVVPIDRIYVSGEVVRSGPLIPPVGEILTVSRALSMAGGLGRYASSTIQVVREGETLQIDINEVLNGKTTDPQLKPGDAIFVPQRRF